jgi:hypothetical protein
MKRLNLSCALVLALLVSMPACAQEPSDAAGPYTVTIPGKDGASTEIHGGWLQVLKRDSGSWKIQAASFTRFNAPPPTK